jgi:pectinesterase
VQVIILQASTPEGKKFGYVFMNCSVTGNAPADSFLLGRPWRPFAKTVFLNCKLDKQVRPEGWSNWSNPLNEKTAYYAEYKNYGRVRKPKKELSGRTS